jgi:hypothetical protein
MICRGDTDPMKGRRRRGTSACHSVLFLADHLAGIRLLSGGGPPHMERTEGESAPVA